ncbi:hypothetical protein [Pseudomonas sp. C32]|uniref:hypothetical protein n=1 Tax=Pseudomonas sp. C32 TaxID=1529208 RepID=UPI00260ADCFA|nr:hypothetical protein [Pseudomonas sp. C32]MDN4547557.1 hypothetical protein [Pseudomonas sp. C32]
MSVESGKPARLSVFKVQFDGGAALTSKKIYANGKMQVRVRVILAAVDGGGKLAILTPSIYHSLRLIDYKTGKLLADGWVASERPNEYAQALYGVSADWKEEVSVNPYTHIKELWVSSSVATDAQIGAVVTFNDKSIRSNNTTLGAKFDSSVTLEAENPVIYERSKFRLDAVENKLAHERVLTHFYLSLYVAERQIKLVNWAEKVAAAQGVVSGNHTVFDAHGYYPDNDYWWRSVCIFAGVEEQEVVVKLPQERGSNQSRFFPVRVNDRNGALSIIQGVALEFSADTTNRRGVFYFTAFDIYGTGHDLCLRFNESVFPGGFILEKA